MSSCLLVQSLKEKETPPTLSASQPADVTVWQGSQATFWVEIAEPGVPAEYTYQWYRDGAKWTGATKASVSWSSASVGAHKIYCVVTNKAGEVTSRTATLTVKDPSMYYTYTGDHQKIDDGNGNWRIKLKTSGTLKFTAFGNWDGKVDVFCVGGGGAAGWGWYNGYYGKGACGGFTATKKNVTTAVNTAYTCTIGAGGQESWATGGTTSALNGALTATGGGKLTGGSGGGAYGNNIPYDGGSNGGNGNPQDAANIGIDHWGSPGKGQGTTTREFGESSGTLYAGGGGSGTSNSSRRSAGGAGGGGAGAWSVGSVAQEDGETNTGGGGGGCWYGVGSKVGAGGSGIIVIRNHR